MGQVRQLDKRMNDAGFIAPDGKRSARDEYVQYAGVFERGVEAKGKRKEESGAGKARVGSWVYQEDFAGGV